MNATLYKFGKRKNSTLAPSQATPSISVAIKVNDGNSSILNPEIRLARADSAIVDLVSYNYMYIPNFSRYYHIDNWLFNGDGTWTAYCSVDVLSSWKTQILQTSGYVGRAAQVGYQNKFIPDGLYPATVAYAVDTVEVNTGFSEQLSDGTFIIGVVSHNSPNIGAVAYYAITMSELQTLIQNMIETSVTAWDDLEGLGVDALKSLVNPIQYIVSCKWFPFTFSPSTSLEHIYLWSWDTGAQGKKLDATYKVFPSQNGATAYIRDIQSFNLDADYRPLQVNEWPPYAPYAHYDFITPWGTFELDPTMVGCTLLKSQYHTAEIDIRIMINLVSGLGVMEVMMPTANVAENQAELFRREINVGLDIPLVQMSINYLEGVQKVGNMVGNVGNSIMTSGNWFEAAFRGVASLVGGVVDVCSTILFPSVQSTGGTMAAFTPNIRKIYIQSVRYRTIHQNNATFGKPVKMHVSDLTGFSGYVQMDYPEFRGTCTDDEANQIQEFLMSGVYLE